jgi:hypothetical protein
MPGSQTLGWRGFVNPSRLKIDALPAARTQSCRHSELDLKACSRQRVWQLHRSRPHFRFTRLCGTRRGAAC